MSRFRARVKQRIRSATGTDQALAIVAELTATVDRHRARIGELEREVARVSPQLAALESRVETLREHLENQTRLPTADGADSTPDVRAILAEIQRQQEQVRARISAAARFEERLRKLEEDSAHR